MTYFQNIAQGVPVTIWAVPPALASALANLSQRVLVFVNERLQNPPEISAFRVLDRAVTAVPNSQGFIVFGSLIAPEIEENGEEEEVGPGEEVKALEIIAKEEQVVPGEEVKALEIIAKEEQVVPGEEVKALEIIAKEEQVVPGEEVKALEIIAKEEQVVPGEEVKALEIIAKEEQVVPGEEVKALEIIADEVRNAFAERAFEELVLECETYFSPLISPLKEEILDDADSENEEVHV